LLFLGSDGHVKFRGSSSGPGVAAGRMKPGELTVQHGDVVVLKTGSESVEVQLKMEGFGFGECERRAGYLIERSLSLG
jgi:hypothetical protein